MNKLLYTNLRIILLFTIIFFSNCQTKDSFSELCDYYNEMSPIMVDNTTKLNGVLCSDELFAFRYTLIDYEGDDTENMVLQVFQEAQLSSTVNNIEELNILKERRKNLGYIYEDKNGNECVRVIFAVNENGQFELQKETD